VAPNNRLCARVRPGTTPPPTAPIGGSMRAGGVELDGDAEVQQAVRFGLFHVLQAGAALVTGC